MNLNQSIFFKHLYNKLVFNLKNNYNKTHNIHDYERYGNFLEPKESLGIRYRISNFLKNVLSKKGLYLISDNRLNEDITSISKVHESAEKYAWFYNKLDDTYSKNLFIDLTLYIYLGRTKYLLPQNTANYWEQRNRVKNMFLSNSFKEMKSTGAKSFHMKLNEIGYPIEFWGEPLQIVPVFIMEQYRYNSNNVVVEVEDADIVLDCGAYIGDTALYFSLKIGNTGKVHAFELIQEHMNAFNENMKMNSRLSQNINLYNIAMWEYSGKKIYVDNRGAGSKVSEEPIDGTTVIETITIDDWSKKNNVEKVDFIKMDIEGAELPSLKGATETLKKYKPKLAIALYHNTFDFYEITKFIDDLNLGYKFYLNHYTTHREETILFATCK